MSFCTQWCILKCAIYISRLTRKAFHFFQRRLRALAVIMHLIAELGPRGINTRHMLKSEVITIRVPTKPVTSPLQQLYMMIWSFFPERNKDTSCFYKSCIKVEIDNSSPLGVSKWHFCWCSGRKDDVSNMAMASSLATIQSNSNDNIFSWI